MCKLVNYDTFASIPKMSFCKKFFSSKPSYDVLEIASVMNCLRSIAHAKITYIDYFFHHLSLILRIKTLKQPG